VAGGRLTRGERNCRWIEQFCRIPEGKDVGKPVKLRPWQRRDIKKIYDNPAGTRRGILSFGRKNAKTTEAAFLLLLHTCGPEARINSQLNSAAQSKDQAAVLFKLAAKIVRMSPDLNSVVIIRDTVKELFCPELGTLYKALSAEASTLFRSRESDPPGQSCVRRFPERDRSAGDGRRRSSNAKPRV
jgi:phage terminase large subunit-like protein